MKHLKMLGPLAAAVAMLAVFASNASATPVLTSPAGVEYTGTIHATLEEGTTTLIKAGVEDTCTESTAHGTVTVNNTTHAESALTGFSFGSCTQHTTVTNPGRLTVGDTGTVFLSEFTLKITVTSPAEFTCAYMIGPTPLAIGTLTAGTPATLDVSTTKLEKDVGSFLCASTATWTGSYVVTTPSSLFIT